MDKQFKSKLEEWSDGNKINSTGVEIDQFLLSLPNSLFTLVNGIDVWLDETRLYIDRTNDEVIKESLMYDDDLSNLLILLKSINENGWITSEKIYITENKDNGNYVIVDGNQRFLAINLLTKKVFSS